MTAVLVVDDDPDLLELFAFTLEDAGYDVRTAPSGPVALQVVDRVRVDLVVTDFHMPQMNGVQLAMQLRSTPRGSRIPVIVVSAAAASDQDPDELISRWLTKPVSSRQLRAEVADILHARTPASAEADRPAGPNQRWPQAAITVRSRYLKAISSVDRTVRDPFDVLDPERVRPDSGICCRLPSTSVPHTSELHRREVSAIHSCLFW